MTNRIIRLAKALTNEGVKRLPWIILIFLILLFIQFVRFNTQTAENTTITKANSVDTKTLLMKVAQLSEDNKKLTQQNIDLAKQNASHLDCIANLFVHYTQNLRPIADYNLTTCSIATTAPSIPVQPSPRSSAPLSKASPSVSSSQQDSPAAEPGQPNNSQLPDCKVDVLFIHIDCGS